MSAFKKTTMKEQVYHLIKERILNQTYAFGEKINMLELSQEFGISNSPIREALSLLESERLVTFIPNVGPSVVNIDAAFFEETKQAAIVFLLGGYDQCLQHNRVPELISEMEDCLSRQKKLIHDQSTESSNKFARISVEFDLSLVKVLQNQILDHLYSYFFNLLLLVTLYNHQLNNPDREKNIAEHELILDAVKSGNFEEVKKSFYAHYNRYVDHLSLK